MASPIVLQLTRRLDARPKEPGVEKVALRSYAGKADVEPWLALRKAAFADLKAGVRDWQGADFETEFLQASWWSPERMWLITSEEHLVGSATLALRGSADTAKPVIHWMMVHPQWQRRGIGRLLVARLEAQAWDQGHRQIFLETHASWQAAVAFYESLGYRPA